MFRFVLAAGLLGMVLVACEAPDEPEELTPTPVVFPTSIFDPGEISPVYMPKSTPTSALAPGMYRVGADIEPGVYAGMGGWGEFDSCYWERLSGASGEPDDVLANADANGQFYIEVLDSDRYFRTDCAVVPLSDWRAPRRPPKIVEMGMHLVGRDIAPGRYKGGRSAGYHVSCYWARLSGLSGDSDDIIANDNVVRPFYVTVEPTDLAVETSCFLEKEE